MPGLTHVLTGCRRATLRFAVDAPLNLAVFRIAVGLALLALPDLHHAARWAELPPSARVVPVGMAWALPLVPVTPSLVRAAYRVLVVAVVTGTVGVYTRLSWTVATVLGLYVLGAPQLAGSVFHYHHLIWFAALLAASPSGDALSADAWLEGRGLFPRRPERTLAHGVPLRAAWLLIGGIFFFPGLHKLLTSGWAWALSDNLQNHMYAKWVQFPEYAPLFRVDRFPKLLRVGAVLVVIFELTFVVGILVRRTRLFAVLAALLFHQLTAAFMALRFSALYLTYVCFVDWDRLVRRIRGHTKAGRQAPGAEVRGEGTARSRAWPSVLVSLVLVFGSMAAGVVGQSEGWPFACYPKFDRMMGSTLPELEVELLRDDGSAFRVPPRRLHDRGGSQRWWGLSWSLLGAHTSAKASPERFDDFWEQAAARPAMMQVLEGTRSVRFYRVVRSTVPEERDQPPRSRTLLYERPVR